MMTRKQIANEVEQFGYEYAETAMSPDNSDDFAEYHGIAINDGVYQKVSFEDLFDWIASGGDAFPEQRGHGRATMSGFHVTAHVDGMMKKATK